MSVESHSIRRAVPDPRDLTIFEQATQIKNREEKLAILEEKLRKLEALLASQAEVKSSKTPVFPENHSVDRNKTVEKKSRKKSNGRKPAEAKLDQVTDTVKTTRLRP